MSNESSSSKSGKSSKLLFLLVALGLVPVALACTGILAAIAIPNFVAMQYRAKRSEVPANIDGIRTKLLARKSAGKAYVACGSEAGAKAIIEKYGGKQMHPFNAAGKACWKQLGWSPGSDIRGEYWVAVTNGGKNFEVNGISDVDGDGQFARYEATKQNEAVQITAGDVY